MGGPASLLDAQASTILTFVAAATILANTNISGAATTDSGSSQATGANTPPTLAIDVAATLDAKVDGQPIEVAAQAGLNVIEGDPLAWGAIDGKSAIVAVAITADGVAHLVAGAPADTGSEVAPTDAEIEEVLGGKFVRSAELNIERTADTAITVTIAHAGVRPTMPKLAPIALNNTEFTQGGFERVFPITPSAPPA